MIILELWFFIPCWPLKQDTLQGPFHSECVSLSKDWQFSYIQCKSSVKLKFNSGIWNYVMTILRLSFFGASEYFVGGAGVNFWFFLNQLYYFSHQGHCTFNKGCKWKFKKY